MPDTSPPLHLVLTTTATADEAARIGRTLVEEHLAACATLLPSAQSIYRWQGQLETATETLLLLKTAPAQLASLEARLLQLHSYQIPEFLVLPVETVNQSYIDWLTANLPLAQKPAPAAPSGILT